jgi:hypothetical protein
MLLCNDSKTEKRTCACHVKHWPSSNKLCMSHMTHKWNRTIGSYGRIVVEIRDLKHSKGDKKLISDGLSVHHIVWAVFRSGISLDHVHWFFSLVSNWWITVERLAVSGSNIHRAKLKEQPLGEIEYSWLNLWSQYTILNKQIIYMVDAPYCQHIVVPTINEDLHLMLFVVCGKGLSHVE